MPIVREVSLLNCHVIRLVLDTLRVVSTLDWRAIRLVLDARRVLRLFGLFIQPLRLSDCSDVPLVVDAFRAAWLAVLFLRLIRRHRSPLLSVRARSSAAD